LKSLVATDEAGALCIDPIEQRHKTSWKCAQTPIHEFEEVITAILVEHELMGPPAIAGAVRPQRSIPRQRVPHETEGAGRVVTDAACGRMKAAHGARSTRGHRPRRHTRIDLLIVIGHEASVPQGVPHPTPASLRHVHEQPPGLQEKCHHRISSQTISKGPAWPAGNSSSCPGTCLSPL